MKFLPLFLLLFFILLTHAQRRTTTTAKSTAVPDNTPKPISRGRGRSRFVSSPEYADPTSSTESSSRKPVASRRRVVENIEQKFPSRTQVASSTPKQLNNPTIGSRRTATADKIFLNDNIDRKPARPLLVENVNSRNTATSSPFRAFNNRPKNKNKNSYEVQEPIDDVDPYRRKKQPRVLTETNFKAANFPKRSSLDNAEPTPDSSSSPGNPNPNSLDEQPSDTTLKPEPELETPIGPLTEEVALQEETQKTVPVSSTVKPTEPPRPNGGRRTGLRKIPNRVAEPVIATPAPGGRIRTRTRPTQAPDFYFQSVSTSVPSTSFRRRVDSLFSSIEPRKGPSVFNADTTASESRSRTGRKTDVLPAEKIPSRGRRVSVTPASVKSKSTQTPATFRSRGGGRFRSREMPIIDEQKLEVLPLFEEEPKIVPTRGVSRNENLDSSRAKELKNRDVAISRTSNRDEKLHLHSRTRSTNRADTHTDSRSKNKVTFVEKEKPTVVDLKTRRRGYPADYIEGSATETDMKITVTVNVENTTQPFKVKESIPPIRPSTTSTPSRSTQVKESVTSEINEVTSRRKVSRKKVIKQKVPIYRGSKKSEVKLEKKQSSEEIGESDNYPEEFKALLKAKKEHKESRPSPSFSSSSSTLSSTISVVTSSTPPSTTAYLLTTRQFNDNENEIKPKPLPPSTTIIASTSPRYTRSRYTPSTSTRAFEDDSSTRRQSFRTTTSSTPLSRGTKHFITFPSRGNNSSKLERNVSFKPRTSSSENEIRRVNRGRNGKQPTDSNVYTTKVPKYSATPKKVDRSKYRSGSTTIAPKYIPTIPSVPYVPTVPVVTTPRTWVGTKDDDLGLQVISIDEPVHAIPSANLVNGNYKSATENSVAIPLPLVNGGTTEKPVSIIERIINSITARSTVAPTTDTVTKITASTTESPSAILKLAPKRARQTDKTDDTRHNVIDTVSLTTENPTTIIEKILSSLNAIQATDTNGSVQVGTNFNTLSSFTTTPLPSVTKSSTRSLLALSSTSVNPLSILDEITPEEVLQKRTIGRLLDILNGLVVSTPVPSSENLVVVTPKSVNKPSTTYYPAISSTSPTSIFTSSLFSTNDINYEAPSTVSSSSDAISSTDLFSTTAQAIFTSSELPTTAKEPSTADSVTSTVVTEEASTLQEQSSTLIPVNNSNVDESLITSSTTIEPTTSSLIPVNTFNSDETLLTSSTTVEPQTEPATSSFPSASEVGLKSTTEGVNFFTALSTLPSLERFEVSPGSVSVYSANDLSNAITPDDNFSTTTIINIAGRSNFDNTATTQSTTTEVETTTLEVTTEADNSGAMESSTPAPVTVNSTQTNRSGKLLNVLEEPVQNSIDTSTPDYFIFAVLNNNTVLRKRPLVEPNAPFVVIGVYPNNTVVKKYPNGTEVPMESIIRVRGFDTRQNPPPLPEITSNQVTSESGSSVDNKIVETDEQNTIPSESKSLSTAASTTTTTTTSTATTTRITSKFYKASSSAQSSSTVATPSRTISPETDSISSTSSTPMSTILITGRTIEPISTVPTNTIASNANGAGTTLPNTVTVKTSTVYSTTQGGKVNPTLPTLSELLNGNILDAYNEIVNKTDNKNFDIPKSAAVKVNTVDSVTNPTSTSASLTTESSTTETPKIEISTRDSALLSNSILDERTTTVRTTRPTKGRRLTTTPTIQTTTFFPTFLSTLFPNVFETTRFPIVPTRAPEGVIRISAAPSVDETLSLAASTTRPTTVRPTTTTTRRTTTTTTTTTKPTTTSIARRRTTTTTTAAPTTRRTTIRARSTTTTTSPPVVTTTAAPITSTYQTVTAASSTKRSATVADFNTVEVTTLKTIKLNELSQEQRENLRIIAQLEKEQAQLLQQLSFLTNLGLGPNRGTKPPTNANRNPNSSSKTLAERIVALAVERDKTTTVESTIPTTTRQPNSIQDQLAAIQTTRQPKKATSLDDVLKQLNLNGLNVAATTPSPTIKSDDAILNSLLREQGIIPPTPKSLAGIFDDTAIIPRSRPRATVPPPPPPGPLMRGLNWLLTALGPQPQPQIVPTRKPTRKPTKPTKPKKPPVDLELLANSPTHVTPVVTRAPSKTANALSQDDIQKLIRQLEGIQKNPSKETLDLSQIKSIQHLINLDEGVVVMTNGEHGATSRRTTAAPTTIRSRSRQPTQRQPRKLPTEPPPLIVSVSNSVEEFDEFETTTSRVLRAPIGFRPVPGVDDDNPNTLVRSNLITAAVNVTKAISSFLGTALQGAASSFSSLFGGGSALGSRLLGNAAVGSSAG